MQPRIIVTGAAGFIGCHLCVALLESGAQVVGIDNFDPFYGRALKLENVRRIRRSLLGGTGSVPPAAFDLVECDIRNSEVLHDEFARIRPQAVFHLAAMTGVRPSVEDPRRCAEVNIEGLVHVLEACRAVDCRRFLLASSSSVYGNNRRVPFAEEDSVDHPISPYSATKRAGEMICQSYARAFAMRCAVLRLFTVYGPAQRPDLAIAKFMRLIAAGEHVPMFGDGSTSRDYTYIDDVIAGVLAAWELVDGQRAPAARSASGEQANGGFFRIYNLGSDRPITLRHMIDAIARTVGKPARIRAMPVQPGDVERTWADLTRSRSELAYRLQTSFDEGLAKHWRALRMTDCSGEVDVFPFVHTLLSVPMVGASGLQT